MAGKGVHPTTADGEHYDGVKMSKGRMGQTIVQTYGKDASSMCGNSRDERDSRISNKADLSHSISGTSVPAAPSRGGGSDL